MRVIPGRGCVVGLWEHSGPFCRRRAVRNQCGSRSPLESRAVEGDSPVGVRHELPSVFPSNTEPLKFRVNLAGPPVKPKYSLMTDSGQVP